MTRAKTRKFLTKLDGVLKHAARLEVTADSLKQDVGSLKMEIHELRSELQDELDDTPKRPEQLRREARSRTEAA